MNKQDLAEVVYPSRDGRPVAETDTHRRVMRDLVYGLRHHFRNRRDVYVGGALFLFYEEGNPKKFVVPDVMICFKVPTGKRDTYLMWEEDKAPDVVIELTSQSTKSEDLVLKKNLYARLGVSEYYIFDPQLDYLPQALVGFQLSGAEYAGKSPDHPMFSPALGLELQVDGASLRLHDASTDETLPRFRHIAPSQVKVRSALQAAERARREAEERADQAESARQQAELARQVAAAQYRKAESDRHRAEVAQQQAEQERRQALKARQEAEAERQMAEAARRQAEAERRSAILKANHLESDLKRLLGKIDRISRQ